MCGTNNCKGCGRCTANKTERIIGERVFFFFNEKKSLESCSADHNSGFCPHNMLPEKRERLSREKYRQDYETLCPARKVAIDSLASAGFA